MRNDMLLAGYDIGGTKCAVSLGIASGDKIEIIGKRRFDTAGAPSDIIEKLARELDLLLRDDGYTYADVASAGISCGGPLDSRRGVILSPPNLPGWDDIHIVETLEKFTGVNTLLQNDANACAVAEWKFGAGRGCENMVFLTFGTGLGAGLILNNRLYSGANDMAGEIGHIRLAPDGPMGYGKSGSAEGFCSGGGIARSAIIAIDKSLKRGHAPEILNFVGGDTSKIDARLIAERAKAGDEFCQEIFSACGRRLGLALSVIIDILNPEMIILGGVFMRAEALLRESMEQVIREEALTRSARACSVVPAELGEMIGDYAAVSVACL